MAEETRVDVLIKRIKNHRWLSLAVAGGVIFLALVSLAKGLQEAGTMIGEAHLHSALISQYDASTKDALLAAAHDVDLFFLKIESSSEPVTFSAVKDDFFKIKAELRSILMRNRVRPLNYESAKQSELLVDQWDKIENLLQRPEGINPEAIRIARELMFQSFDLMLALEEAKQLAPK